MQLNLGIFITYIFQVRAWYNNPGNVRGYLSPQSDYYDDYNENRELKIWNGTNATSGQFPFLVELRFESNQGHQCGGSILNEIWIVTAGHCLDGYPLIVVAGQLYRVSDDPERQFADIKRVIIHEWFNRDTAEFDIGLIELKTPLDLTGTVGKAKIGLQKPHVNDICTIAGWGSIVYGERHVYPDVLQTANLIVRQNEDCQERSGKLIVHPYTICLFNIDESTSACGGDSGGPLICNGLVVGVLSTAPRLCVRKHPASVYTSIPYFIDWITERSGIIFQRFGN